jgi:sulfite reductase (NADPH) flavoprotein alpha-component
MSAWSLAKDRAKPLQLMAAMAQLDCGQCGYLCDTYAAAIADWKRKKPAEMRAWRQRNRE